MNAAGRGVPDAKLDAPLGLQGRLPVLAVFVAWTAWGLWTLHQRTLAAMLTGTEPPVRANPWPLTMGSAWFWALATLAVIVSTRRIRERYSSTTHRFLAHAAAFGVLHLVDTTVYWAVAHRFGGDHRPYLTMLFALVTFNALAYALVASATTAFDAATSLRSRAIREARLEAQLNAAQLHALRAQLQPHFLFNALNAVASLIPVDSRRAERMVARLGDLLRFTIDTAPIPQVTLADEFALAKRYLEIEEMRYGDRLTVHIELPADLEDVPVPNMILQPLLENAVRHGVAPYARPGRVTLGASREADSVLVTIHDSGNGFEPSAPRGVGLGITEDRLVTTYGPGRHLVFRPLDDGFETRLVLPVPATT